MTSASSTSSNADEIIDVALHDELMCRAYELYDLHPDTAIGSELKLQSELPRVAYALSQMQNHDGKTADTRAIRAARVYLRALICFVRPREMR